MQHIGKYCNILVMKMRTALGISYCMDGKVESCSVIVKRSASSFCVLFTEIKLHKAEPAVGGSSLCSVLIVPGLDD